MVARSRHFTLNLCPYSYSYAYRRPSAVVRIRTLRESRDLLEFIQSIEGGDGGIDMANAHAHAHLLDDMPLGAPQAPRRAHLTMLQLDDMCADPVNMGLMPLDDQGLPGTPGLPGIAGMIEDHDATIEAEAGDEQVDMLLDMEGVGTDDPVR